MRKLLILLFTFLSLSQVAWAQEPNPNLMLYKDRLVSYYNSGEYDKDLRQVEKQAMSYLMSRVEQNSRLEHPKQLAIVFDVDETTLSNYPHLKHNDFAFPHETIYSHMSAADDQAIPAMKELYDAAIKYNVAVFFITGRFNTFRDATIRNLQVAGYTKWNEVFLKPTDYKEKTGSVFKIATRKSIEAKGYDIALNIGDQQSDLIGGYADKTFKLPNPYYYVP